MIDEILEGIPSFSEELGLDLKNPEDRFRWFIASILFAKPISFRIADKTIRLFLLHGLTSPEKILNAGWDRLVELLDVCGYVRYDFSTASNILETVKLLKEKYGDLERLHDEAKDSKDLEKRLMEFKGVGKTAVNIFLRELRGIWEKANPEPSKMALSMAEKLKVDAVKYESALVRIYLEYCKKKRCEGCPVGEYCSFRA
ncbi:hypothetical protein [Archaeoglobus veneficus]|uniref:Putative cytoplasmic protein n=1 Tax=Archaeoglobus veneficus (strain DSM 11195 / SNP6) TaxID=693661 RepID=F2KSE3_ARCVS|nr:hypothetical protein [Archaeoglobus veneficus]AEA46912.1 putative cytoplasmic protein [Archaeoglobus veneficus SNP6]